MCLCGRQGGAAQGAGAARWEECAAGQGGARRHPAGHPRPDTVCAFHARGLRGLSVYRCRVRLAFYCSLACKTCIVLKSGSALTSCCCCCCCHRGPSVQAPFCDGILLGRGKGGCEHCGGVAGRRTGWTPRYGSGGARCWRPGLRSSVPRACLRRCPPSRSRPGCRTSRRPSTNVGAIHPPDRHLQYLCAKVQGTRKERLVSFACSWVAMWSAVTLAPALQGPSNG